MFVFWVVVEVPLLTFARDGVPLNCKKLERKWTYVHKIHNVKTNVQYQKTYQNSLKTTIIQ